MILKNAQTKATGVVPNTPEEEINILEAEISSLLNKVYDLQVLKQRLENEQKKHLGAN